MREEYTDTIERYRRDCTLQEMTAESIRRYISCVKIYAEFLEERNISFEQVQYEDLIDFIQYLKNERKVGVKTLENYLSSMNSLYDYLMFKKKVTVNIVPIIRKRYVKRYKKENGNGNRRKVLSEEEMSSFLNGILNPRDKAIATLLVKTGIRRGELIAVDLNDIDWTLNSIELKDKKKRSNAVVFFDNECARILRHWINIRDREYVEDNCDALFIGQGGKRLDRHGVSEAIVKWAKLKGIYDTSSKENKDHFSPHNMRHCFTTYLLQNKMDREYVQELRGDARRSAVDIYNHIDPEKLREAYLAAMPQFGL